MMSPAEQLVYAPHMTRAAGIESEYGVLFAHQHTDEHIDMPYRDVLSEMQKTPGTTWINNFSNMGRTYVDVGLHPEHATNEFDDYKMLAMAKLGGDLFMVDAVQRVLQNRQEAERGVRERAMMPLRSSDDLGHFWGGAHINMAIPRSVFMYMFPLPEHAITLPNNPYVAELASYIVASSMVLGSGSVQVTNAGVHFVHPFERLHASTRLASPHTTSYRPIVNSRDEAHAFEPDHARLHTIALDVHTRPITTAVQLGCLSAMLRTFETGKTLPVWLADPLGALKVLQWSPQAPVTVENTAGITTLMKAPEFFARILDHLQQIAEVEGLPEQEQWALGVADQATSDYAEGRHDTKAVKDAMPWIAKDAALQAKGLLGKKLTDEEVSELHFEHRTFDTYTVYPDRIVTGGYLASVRPEKVGQKAREIALTPPSNTRAASRFAFIKKEACYVKKNGGGSIDWSNGSVRPRGDVKMRFWHSSHPKDQLTA